MQEIEEKRAKMEEEKQREKAAAQELQKRIADVLGKLDDKIELNRKMNRTLEKMAAAIFKSWFIDFDPVHGVHRPNHALAHAIRKAMYVPMVVRAYSRYYASGTYFNDKPSSAGHVMARDTFSALGPQDIDALQIALLFEVVGRKSDIGHHDSQKIFAELLK